MPRHRNPSFFFKNRLSLAKATPAFSYDTFAQQRLHSGSPYSLSFKGVGLANPDDLGPNNGAATKEISKRLGAYAGASAAYTLYTNPVPFAGDLSFANWTSHAFRKLAAANFGPQNFFGLTPVLPAAAGALNVGLSQTPEVSSSLRSWALAALAALGPASSLQKLNGAAYSLPAARLAAASSLPRSTAASAFFSRLRPFSLGGASLPRAYQTLSANFARPLTSKQAFVTSLASTSSATSPLYRLVSAQALSSTAPAIAFSGQAPRVTPTTQSRPGQLSVVALRLACPRAQAAAAKVSPAPLFDAPFLPSKV